jgi:hypothetical protein
MMNFEQQTFQYLLELKKSNVLIEAFITGVSEDFRSSTCVGRFLQEDGTVAEKYIVVHEKDDQLVWNFLEVLDNSIQN